MAIFFGKSVGDIYPTSDLNDPNFTFRRGAIGNDVPVSFKRFGIYQFSLVLIWDLGERKRAVFTGFPEINQCSCRSRHGGTHPLRLRTRG